jgi:hypothetical protein
VRTLLSSDQTYSLLPLITTQGEPVVARAAERLAAIICSGWPQVMAADAQLLAECLVRLAISYAALPAGPTGMTAASVTALLGPYIERLLSEANGNGA